MITFPRRFGALSFVMAAGLASAAAQTTIPAVPVAQDPPQVSSPTAASSTAEQATAADMVHTDSQGRHFAPRGTFYLLSYVAVKTDKGVEGFDPGQEVRFVEAHRDTQSLVVTNGRAQVEVPASKLTNDIDIAAMVRRNDQAGQTQIAAYVQAEEAAYAKAEKDAADATAKDFEHRKEEQAVQQAQIAQAQVQAEATPEAAASINNGYDNGYGGGGYYGNGGYGYGSPS